MAVSVNVFLNVSSGFYEQYFNSKTACVFIKRENDTKIVKYDKYKDSTSIFSLKCVLQPLYNITEYIYFSMDLGNALSEKKYSTSKA